MAGEPFVCEGGQLKKSSPCKPKVCHQVTRVGNGICEQTPLPVGAPCDGGVCSAKATCGCVPRTKSCLPPAGAGAFPMLQTCNDDGVYTKVVCPKGCHENTCYTM
jgi:hypothetical protein